MSPSRSSSPTPDGPLPIRRLDEALVNRIAAGEIIQRPASALKELIENSLDAGSTQIKITIKDGGLKMLQIADNGKGIRKADLPILCERFTTSKLTAFSDLQSLTTYGFRGEALASISHVSHLSVTTKTKDDSCAWKAFYADGALTSPKPGTTPDPKPCAGNDGTTITAEDLFYNTPTRLASFRSSSDEYGRILDVVTRYAVHNPTVSFTCKKFGTSAPEVSTPSGSTVPATIKLLYGATVARELIQVSMSSETRKKKERLKGKGKAREDDPDWEAEAYVTNANYHVKKMTFLLFINHRLVDSPRIKRALEGIYAPILPKGSYPFIYLSLLIDPSQVDVNVHPTKREVHFMNEDKIIDDITDAIQLKVASHGESRIYEYQTVLTGGGITTVGVSTGKKEREGKRKRDEDGDEVMDEEEEGEGEEGDSQSKLAGPSQKPKKAAPQHQVRTSTQDRTLESMFAVRNSGQGDGELVGRTAEAINESKVTLVSVLELREAALKGRHGGLTEIVEKHTFVGIVDLKLGLSLIQHATKLYLVNHASLAEELFYQLALRQFANLPRLKLQPAPPIRMLIKLAVDAEGDEVLKSGMDAELATETIVELLLDKRVLMEEYFSFRINSKGELESLPLILKDYTPNLDRLPQLLMRLGTEVVWISEPRCFETFLRELAYFHRPGPIESFVDGLSSSTDPAQEKAERWQIEHVVFPAARRYLVAPKSLLEGDVVQVASLPDLYRIFERC